MKVSIFTLTLFFTTNFLYGQEDTRILNIRKTVQQINADTGYKIKARLNDYFVDVKNEAADNGQELHGYYKKGIIKKIIYDVGLSNCMKTYEYYFSDGWLAFVFEKEKDFPELKNKAGEFTGLDYSKVVPAFEGRYYFDKGKLIRAIIKGKEKSPYHDKAFFLAYARNLLNDLKGAKTR